MGVVVILLGVPIAFSIAMLWELTAHHWLGPVLCAGLIALMLIALGAAADLIRHLEDGT